jgi:lipid intermediate transporter
MPLCTNCAQAVPYLYTVYHSVNNARLEQCVCVHFLPLSGPLLSYPLIVTPPLQPSCRAPADPYVEHDALVVALDLILLKRGVYRHLLFNRGTPPKKVDEKPARGHDQPLRLGERNAEEKWACAEDNAAARERVRYAKFRRLGLLVALGVDSVFFRYRLVDG